MTISGTFGTFSFMGLGSLVKFLGFGLFGSYFTLVLVSALQRGLQKEYLLSFLLLVTVRFVLTEVLVLPGTNCDYS